MKNKKPLQMGWFCPTIGDTTAFGDPSQSIPQSLDHFEKVTLAAEQAGFEYMLIPVSAVCWDAWVTASYLAARSKKIKMLVALKPGHVHPVTQAKMISTFDQLTNGRICINLIAGVSEKDSYAEGQLVAKEDRYDQLLEEVELMKRLWTEEGVEHQGRYFHTHGPKIIPKTVQKPHPDFYLGGGSEQAAEISAKHSKVHLFWGDYPARIKEQIDEMRERAAKYGRADEIEFAMRLQIICRESEEEAWAAADSLIAGAENSDLAATVKLAAESSSVASQRVAELSKTVGRKMTPHLWTGITEVRPGAGVAVVGNPQQVADQLMEFVEAGCSGFCLSGYPHHEEAERFGRLVMPLLRTN